MDSLGMVRMAMQVEVEEEALCLNMKAMASFLLHFHHLWLGGWFQKEKGALWKSEDPLLSKYFHLADIADPLFLIAIGLSDRHSGNKPSLRDIGLGVIWFEYLWVFPFGVRARSLVDSLSRMKTVRTLVVQSQYASVHSQHTANMQSAHGQQPAFLGSQHTLEKKHVQVGHS